MLMGKTKVGYYIEKSLDISLNRLAEKYEGNKGDLAAAAIWMFLNAEKEAKAKALREVLGRNADELFGLSTPPAAESGGTATPALPPGTPKMTRQQRKKKGEADEKAG